MNLTELYIESVERYGPPPKIGIARALCRVEHSSAIWHELRRTGVGASETPGILRIGAYDSPYSIKRKKVDGDTFAGNYHTRRGHALEPVALDEFKRETGIGYTVCKWRLAHKQHDWIQCELDGWAEDGSPIECKAPGPNVLGDMKRLQDGEPVCPVGSVAGYVVQLHHQMIITGADHGWLVVLPGTYKPMVVRVEYDPELGKRILEALTDFWNRCMIGDEEPEVCGLDLDAVRAAWHLEHLGERVLETPDAGLAAMLAEYDEAKAEHAARLAVADELKPAVKTALAKVEQRASLYQAKKLRFRVEGQHRTITLVERKDGSRYTKIK